MRTALLICSAVGVLLLPVVGQAQSVSVTATVLGTVSAEATETLNFGTEIHQNTTVSVNPLEAPSGAGQNRGEMEITHNGPFSSAVSITPLTDGETTLPATYHCAYTADSGGTTGLDGTNVLTLCNSLPNRTSSGPTTFLMVGGSLTVPEGTDPGVYTGSLLFTFTPIGS